MLRPTALGLAACLANLPMPADSHELSPQTKWTDTSLPPLSTAGNADARTVGHMNAIVNAFKVWNAGATLHVCFIGGTRESRDMFVDAERTWENAANLRWDFGSTPDRRNCSSAEPSHIRVSFDHSGSWSRVGTDAIDARVVSLPSLNIDLASFGPPALANRKAIRGTMLHEIGHALGLEHEHQSPDNVCISHMKWDVVYLQMAQPPNGWAKEKVDQNIRPVVDTERLRATEYDPLSIMHYSFPASWFDTPSCARPTPQTLSQLDIEEAKSAYPATPADQEEFIKGVGVKTARLASTIKLTDEQKKGLQTDIRDRAKLLSPALLPEASRVISISGTNSGIIITGNIVVETKVCGPVIIGAGGAVQVDVNCVRQTEDMQ